MFNIHSSKKVSEFFRKQGQNIIPIISGTKLPRADKGEVDGWKENKCKVEIKDNDSIAMLHGQLGNTWACDFDDHNILDELINDKEKKKELLIVKTPKQGHHIIWQRDPDDYPPEDTSFYDSKNRKIDIRHKGYTLLPPSTHPDSQFGKYQFLNESYKPVLIKWSNFVSVLHEFGFFSKSDKNETGYNGKKYDYGLLLVGKFTRGERRVKQKSLYIQKRILDSSHERAVEIVNKINQTCIPPIDEREFEINMKSAERFYEDVVKVENKGKPQKKKIKPNLYEYADIIRSKYNFITTELDEIYFFVNGIYRPNGEHLISQNCRKLWSDLEIHTSDISEIINIIKDTTGYIKIDEFDSQYNKLNFKNGIYDLSTDIFTEKHDPKLLSRIQCNVFYDKTKKCPKFEKFLSTSLEEENDEDDDVKTTTVLEMMALCFISSAIVEKAFIHVGAGSNGKSTLLNILTSIIGLDNITAKTIHDFEYNRFSVSALEGKLANISADVGKKGIKNTELIKKLIGGDPVDAEKKFKGTYAFRPRATLIFSANELPEVDDSSDGFARKFELIKWEKKFYGKDRDHSVKQIQHNSNEISGIMNLLIPIMKRLIKNQSLKYESTVEQTKMEWIRESDSISKFIEDMTSIIPNEFTVKTTLYQNYVKYCIAGKFRQQTPQKFNKKMIEKGFTEDIKKVYGTAARVWFGVSLASELRNEEQKSIL